MMIPPYRHARAPSPAAPRLALAAALSLLSACSVNDLFLEPREALQVQAADPVDPHSYGDRPVDVVVANRAHNKLTGWLFSQPGDRGTVLVAGGNGMGIAHTYTYNRFLLGHGFRVLVFSYQGFDGNEGEADIASLPGDTEAFYRYAAERFPSEPIGFLGESIGATAGFCAAADDEFSAVALEGLIDPKSIAYTITDTWFSPPFSYLLTAMVKPLAGLYASTVPNELGADSCSARLRQTDVLFLHQRNDPVSAFATIEHLAQLRPRHSSVVELPHPTPAHLSLGQDIPAQDRVVDFLLADFAKSSSAVAGRAPVRAVPEGGHSARASGASGG
ncbi:MAG TPA: hypothetical protein VJO12_05750 [Stellaceae bacterium]|nr:hypothetical protein [Stellaceae bacterium]